MRAAIFIVVLLGLAVRAAALDLEVQVHHFTWTERDRAGRTMLEESGPLLGLRLAATSAVSESVAWRTAGEAFLGEVDYDGATTLGQPLRTTTAYYGLKLESDLRWDLWRAADFSTGPLGGLSLRTWLRRLDNGARDSNGYDEAWLIAYGRAGWFAERALGGDLRLALEAALRLPIYNGARYSLSGADDASDVSVEPGRELSGEVALVLRGARGWVGVAYEDFAFSRSEAESLPPFQVFQPESEGRLVTVRAGLAF